MTAISARSVLLVTDQDHTVSEIQFVAHPLHHVHARPKEIAVQSRIYTVRAQETKQLVYPLPGSGAACGVADQDPRWNAADGQALLACRPALRRHHGRLSRFLRCGDRMAD